MGWKILLLCFVSLTSATVLNSGWKVGTSHNYNIRGRTLSGHPDVGHQYSGILTKGLLNIVVRSDDVLVAKIHNFEFARIHTHLPDGALSHIPESQLKYERVKMTDSVFEIHLHNGVVVEIRVKKDTPRWEVNVIKSIVSQIQLDTKGENLIKSPYHKLPEEGSNSAVFKTMESSIAGNVETLYELAELPEVEYQEKPWLVPFPHLKGSGKIIEVVKTRNFSRSEQPHSAFDSYKNWKPFPNKIGQYFSRSSVSQAVITGTLNRFTIQSISSINVIAVVPALNKDQKIMVTSTYNLTLSDIQAHDSQNANEQTLTDYVSWKTLTYVYAKPSSSQPQERTIKKKSFEAGQEEKWSGEDLNLSSEEQLEKYSLSDALDWYPLTQGPSFDNSKEMREMKKDINVVENIKKLATEIGKDLQTPQWIQNRQPLPKFLVMVKLLRLLDQQELEELTYELYTEEKDTLKSHVWMVFRDAFVESGSGPALLVLKKLIEEEKVQGEIAAQLVIRTTKSARQPTYEYLRTFYAMTTDRHVKSQSYLNKVITLAFAELVGYVYGHNETTHKFVVNEYIPYLSQELDKAISSNDKEKAQIYIYALGYVAHPLILVSFEKYLEGKVEVSHFLRTQMVISMIGMSIIHPQVVQPVLYRIYRNPGEHQDVRVAAINNLKNTIPSADMFQKMVEYTRTDSNQYVNAAVYTLIKNAAELTTPGLAELQANAQSAIHLLKEDDFLLLNDQNQIQDSVYGPMLKFVHTMRYLGSEDSFYGKALRYGLITNTGGIFDMTPAGGYMSSGIEALVDVLKEQFEREETGEDSNSKWSGEAIRRNLKIKGDKVDDFAANIHFEIAGMRRVFAFDAPMLKQLSKAVMEMEETLGKRQNFHYNKMVNIETTGMSLPTETGLLFIYSDESPYLIQIKGNMSAHAEPKISHNGKLRAPRKINLETEMEISYYKTMQQKIGFYSPFDSQSYFAGYDRNIHSYLPLKIRAYTDMKEKKYDVEVEINAPSERVHVLDLNSEAYTSNGDLYNLPGFKENRHLVDTKPQVIVDQVFGEKATGMNWRVHLVSDNPLNLHSLTSYFKDIHNSKLKIVFDSEHSENRKIKFALQIHDHSEWFKPKEVAPKSHLLQELFNLPEDREDKHSRLLDEARAGIRLPQISMYETNITFEGKREITYNTFVTLSGSAVDEKSRILLHSQKRDREYQDRDYDAVAIINSQTPRINEIDPFYAMKLNPKSKVFIELAFGKVFASATKIFTDINLNRSQKRANYLQASPLSHQCSVEASRNNYQLPACLEFIRNAPLLDQIRMNMVYDNVRLPLRNFAQRVFDFVQYSLYNYRQTNLVDANGSEADNTVNIDVNFRETLDQVTVALRTMESEIYFNDIEIPEWVQPIVVVHPHYSATRRWLQWVTNSQTTTGPSCSVDQTAVNTFDKKTYEMKLTDDWTVMFVYVPNAVKHSGNAKQTEEYVVLTRAQQDERREVKVTIRDPKSQNYKHLEIDLVPATDGVQVLLNEQELKVSDKVVLQINNGLVQMHLLPNNELKLKIKDAFNLFYDGKRARLDMPFTNKFYNKVRGLCGNADGHIFTDFKAPHNCIYNNLQQFVRAYQPYVTHQYVEQAQYHKCPFRKVIFANVITGQDIGVIEKSKNCSKFQTRYQEIEEEICFSEKLLPVCQSGCKSTRYNTKVVSALCLKKDSDRAINMMTMVDSGKKLTFNENDNMKKISMSVPQHCYAY